MSHVNDLPAEILTAILKDVEKEQTRWEFCTLTMETCARWKNLATNSCFWRNIDNHHIPLRTILFLSKKCSLSSTVSISLDSTQLKGRDLELIFSHCPKLQHLRLSSKYHRRVLETLRDRCPRISYLMFTNSMHRLHAHMFYNYFHGGCPNLNHISLICYSFANARSLLEQIADSCPNLRSLCVCITARVRTMVFPITRMQSKCPLLEALQVPHFAFTFEKYADNNGFPELLHLNCAYSLAEDGLPGISDSELAALLGTSTKLTSLNVEKTSISTQGICNLPSLSLKKLVLGRTLAPSERSALINRYGPHLAIS